MGTRVRRAARWGGLAVILSLAVTALLVRNWWQSELNTPYKGFLEQERIVVIPRGTNVREIAERLEGAGVIKSALLFRVYARSLSAPLLQAGEYRFAAPLSIPDVLRRLRIGDVRQIKVTIPEGSDLVQVSILLHDAGLCSIADFFGAVADTTSITDLDPEARDLEGYLMPDTYLLTARSPARRVIGIMVDDAREFWTPKRLARAQELGFSVHGIVTLASLIEKETGNAEERPLVSAVFHNRLKIGMHLMCDPTIIYGVRLLKEFDGVINRSDLALDSPYNTYRYPGLPPGPITNPGRAALEAALYPADVRYLYFVSRNDGTHVFSETYRNHERAVRRYQR